MMSMHFIIICLCQRCPNVLSLCDVPEAYVVPPGTSCPPISLLFFSHSATALVDLGLLSRDFPIHIYSDKPQLVGLLWTRDRPVAETSTWQHTTLTKDRHLCFPRDSNPQSLSKRWGQILALYRSANVIGCLFCDGPKPCGQWTWFMFGCGRKGNVVRGEVWRTQLKPFQVKTLKVLVNSRTKWSEVCSLHCLQRVLVFWYCGTASHCCRLVSE